MPAFSIAFGAASAVTEAGGGGELIANGTFNTDLANWTDAGGNGSAAWVAGTMQITQGSTTTEERRQVLTVQIGATYTLTVTLGGTLPVIFLGSTAAGADYGNIQATGSKVIVATTTTLSVRCQTLAATGSGSTATFDNISVKRTA